MLVKLKQTQIRRTKMNNIEFANIIGSKINNYEDELRESKLFTEDQIADLVEFNKEQTKVFVENVKRVENSKEMVKVYNRFVEIAMEKMCKVMHNNDTFQTLKKQMDDANTQITYMFNNMEYIGSTVKAIDKFGETTYLEHIKDAIASL